MLDAVTANTALLIPAQTLAAAEDRLNTATTALTVAQAEYGDILGHIRNLESRRAAIIERRQHGNQQEGDGAQLALVAADLDGLASMCTEAEAAIEAARGPVAAAERTVETARYVLRRTEDELAEAALIAHAEQLDTAMQQAIIELDALRKSLNRGAPVWAASRTLMNELNRISIQRGWR